MGFGVGVDLEEGELDVLEDEVELLTASRLEAQPRAVNLQRAGRLVRVRVRVRARARVRVRVGAVTP